MDYDFAIIYFGLPRSIKQTYQTHIDNIFQTLKNKNLTYKTFLHTWQINDNKQIINENVISQEIDYNEYKLLNPDFYKIDSQEQYLDNINMDDYFYKDVFDTIGNCNEGEWLPFLIINHLCALESQKRGFEMVENFIEEGNKFKYVMFIRHDVYIFNKLPLQSILLNTFDISIPNDEHYEGYNDRFAILNYEKAHIYGKRINEIAEFRKTNGRIVSEKYVKFIVNKYNFKINFMNFKFILKRPS